VAIDALQFVTIFWFSILLALLALTQLALASIIKKEEEDEHINNRKKTKKKMNTLIIAKKEKRRYMLQLMGGIDITFVILCICCTGS
jgi:hypothetical protein